MKILVCSVWWMCGVRLGGWLHKGCVDVCDARRVHVHTVYTKWHQTWESGSKHAVRDLIFFIVSGQIDPEMSRNHVSNLDHIPFCTHWRNAAVVSSLESVHTLGPGFDIFLRWSIVDSFETELRLLHFLNIVTYNLWSLINERQRVSRLLNLQITKIINKYLKSLITNCICLLTNHYNIATFCKTRNHVCVNFPLGMTSDTFSTRQ